MAGRFFMTCITPISFILLALVSCASTFYNLQANPETSKQPFYSDPEGYAVLSQLIDQAFSKSKASAIDISSATVREEELLVSEGCLKVTDGFQSAFTDFHERNKSSLRLANEFSLKVEYKLAEEQDTQSPPKPVPGEQKLEENFAGRVLFAVSAVGFDPTKTHVLAYVSAYCGVMCAGGAYYLLIKDKQGWKEIPDSPKCEWMSRKQETATSRATS
jgi:hypothetical protein